MSMWSHWSEWQWLLLLLGLFFFALLAGRFVYRWVMGEEQDNDADR